ncbi:DUF2341 domain-containing protein, partial [archaeon]|nr:DUF2341 domain-containing protein [archaeon]
MKKAVSPLISVMLVLVFTVSISTVMLTWVTDYTKTTTQAATKTASGPKGITYCANSNVDISNVVLRNVQVTSNTSVSSGDTNYFNISDISSSIITFTGRSTSIPITDNFDNEDYISSFTNISVSGGVAKLSVGAPTINLWTTNEDWNGGTHTNTTSESDTLGLCWDGGLYCNWDYRKPINVSSTSELTDYQINLSVTWDSDMQDNFEDIRFTYYNATTGTETQISYWIESNTAQTNALVWIKSNLTSGDNTVYMYYGNSVVTSSSDNSTTLLYYNDGTILDFDDLTNVITTSGYIQVYGPNGQPNIYHTITTANLVPPFTFEFDSANWMVAPSWGHNHMYIVGTGYKLNLRMSHGGTDSNLIDDTYGTLYAPFDDWTTTTWHHWKIEMDTNDYVAIHKDNVLLYDGINPSRNLAIQTDLQFQVLATGWSGGNSYIRLDNLKLYSYTANRPTTSFGAEQSQPTSGQYISNTTDTINTISKLKATWNATELNANVNITVDISADNGVSWCMGIVNNT